MITFYPFHPRATIDDYGFIPTFLDEADPRPAAEQFNERYQGGWRPQKGCTLSDKGELLYPGDPAQRPISALRFRDELIVLYPYSYIMIHQRDGSYEFCRMD